MRAERWWEGGERIALSGTPHRVFARIDGSDGPPVTLVHGFPTSSHDWAGIVPALAGRCRVLSVDLLGFGDSDKPRPHDYRVVDQADVVLAAQRWAGLTGGTLVAHDYGVSVAQELLARGVPFDRVAWLNGAVYPDLHRPTDGQVALLGPDGGALAAALTPELLAASMRAVLSRHVDDEVLAELAASTARRDGLPILPALLGYVAERARVGDRWVEAFEASATQVPFLFMWGALDPVSGAHVLARVRERLPTAAVVELADVGHWPAVEAAEDVAAALLSFIAAG